MYSAFEGQRLAGRSRGEALREQREERGVRAQGPRGQRLEGVQHRGGRQPPAREVCYREDLRRNRLPVGSKCPATNV